MKPFIIAVLFAAFASGAGAQSMTDTLTWTVDNLTDMKTNVSSSYSCTFKTMGNNDITWVQGGGTFLSTLTVTSVAGTWADIKQAGNVTYAVTLGEKSGSIRFERNADGVSVTIDFTPAGGLWQKYRVTTIQSN